MPTIKVRYIFPFGKKRFKVRHRVLLTRATSQSADESYVYPSLVQAENTKLHRAYIENGAKDILSSTEYKEAGS